MQSTSKRRLILRRQLTPSLPPAPPAPGPLVFGDLAVGDWFMVIDPGRPWDSVVRKKDTPDTCVTPGIPHSEVNGTFCAARHPMSIKQPVRRIREPRGGSFYPPI